MNTLDIVFVSLAVPQVLISQISTLINFFYATKCISVNLLECGSFCLDCVSGTSCNLCTRGYTWATTSCIGKLESMLFRYYNNYIDMFTPGVHSVLYCIIRPFAKAILPLAQCIGIARLRPKSILNFIPNIMYN